MREWEIFLKLSSSDTKSVIKSDQISSEKTYGALDTENREEGTTNLSVYSQIPALWKHLFYHL